MWLSVADRGLPGPVRPRFQPPPRPLPSAPWQDAEAVLSGFVDRVGAWLRQAGLSGDYPWSATDGAFTAAETLLWSEVLADPETWAAARVFRSIGVATEAELRDFLELPADTSPMDSIAWLVAHHVIASPNLREPLRRCERQSRR